MRIFEIILLIISTIFPFYISIKSDQLNKKIPLAIIGVVILLHFIFEGYRWQMVPAYLIILILVWCLYGENTFFKGGWFRKTITGIAFIILLLFGWGLPYILPVFNLPTPTGTYSVGSQYIHLKTNQDEYMTSEIGDKRELMVKVWYPAILSNEKTEAYLNDGDRIGFAVKYGLPKTTFNYLDNVKTHTYSTPSVAKGEFPVLIFSHGSYSKASGYYALIEEIVSHGYIVLNINHTYESTGALFPNGEIKLYNSEYDRNHNNQEMAEMVWNAMQNYNKAITPEEQYTTVHDLILNYYGAELTERYSKDISLVIDELKKWNTSTFLAQHLDTTKIGVFGHSQGGAAAGQALLDDDRIIAGINVDGMQWGPMIDTMMTKPFALISSEWDSSHPNLNLHAYHNGSSSDFYNAKIPNSGHSNFMDIPLMINLPFINEAGTINPNRVYEITTKTLLQFFDMYLLDKSSNLLELNNKYSELEIKINKKLDTTNAKNECAN
jgi:dienelactone hydrolase